MPMILQFCISLTCFVFEIILSMVTRTIEVLQFNFGASAY
jgi:hypothetical protein